MISRTGSRGFSLIEVLVASVILFAGLGAVLRAYSMAVEALGISDDTLASMDVLREKAVMAELLILGAPDSLQNQSGLDNRNGVEYAWTLEANRLTLTPRVALQTAIFQISRPRGGTPRTLACDWVIFRDAP